MKFLITENQIEKVVFRYLDNQGLIRIGEGNAIYFVYSELDEFVQISYLKNIEHCFIYWGLIIEISNMFSLEEVDSEEIIGRWVENILNMRVVTTRIAMMWMRIRLRIS